MELGRVGWSWVGGVGLGGWVGQWMNGWMGG